MEAQGLTSGEVELLIDGLSDDVAMVWILIDLGIRGNPPPTPGRPSVADVDQAFASLERLVAGGLISVGRIEYVDPRSRGVAPVKHVAEPLAVARERVIDAVLQQENRQFGDWEFACWVVNTDRGDEVARTALDQER